MKEAVMIVLQRDQKFLLGRRSLNKAKAPGYWCPISGHLEVGETEEEAVVREALEEAGVVVRPFKKIGMTPTHDQTVRLHWWLSEILSGEPHVSNEENSELRWFTKEELAILSPAFEEDIRILLEL